MTEENPGAMTKADVYYNLVGWIRVLKLFLLSSSRKHSKRLIPLILNTPQE